MTRSMFFGGLAVLLLAACSSAPTPSLPAGDPSSVQADASSSQDQRMEAQSTSSADAALTGTQPVADPSILSVMLTMEDVQAHGTRESCYTVVDGAVYDITPYIPYHPGGERDIMKICGSDGSALFNRKHGANDEAQAQLARMLIGALAQ